MEVGATHYRRLTRFEGTVLLRREGRAQNAGAAMRGHDRLWRLTDWHRDPNPLPDAQQL